VIDKLLRLFWRDTRVARRLRHRRCHPGLRIDDAATISAAGAFQYGREVCIGPGTLVHIPAGAQLSLDDCAYLGRHAEVAAGGRIRIGRAASLQDRCVILGDVDIGAYCTLAYNVYISSGDHVIDWRPGIPIKVQDVLAPAESRPVVLEEDCWLGNNVLVKAGVRIGRGAVVGANSVVTADIPPYAVVAGAPARAIRARLEYSLPREISFDREDSLPYFHSGFALLGPELADARNSGGFLASRSFAVALNAAGCTTLRIVLRAESSAGTEVEYAGERRGLAAAFREYEFTLERNANIQEFRLVGNDPRARVAGVRVA